jgi:hypothetical protein
MFDLKRQRLFDTVDLKYGSHRERDDGMCAMEMVAFLAGEQHTDHPDCACPVLTGYTIRLNDSMPEAWRQQLKPYLPLLIGSRDGQEPKRAELLAWRAIRVFMPIMLTACHMPDRAAEFRDFRGRLDAAADACYAVFAGVGNTPVSSRVANTARTVTMQAARAAYAAHCAGDARAPHMGRAIDASDTADVAIALTRIAEPDTIWRLAVEALDEALAIGAEERAARQEARRVQAVAVEA